jgi:drug/metabolite transporter (DMT)-like permease
MRVFFYTSFALVAFAFNSILCRMALRPGEADAAGFTVVRLVSGAVTLAVLAYVFGKTRTVVQTGHWASGFFLFAYAICFSFAYLGLSAGMGALILFGSVQLAMIAAALAKGERPGVMEWLGLAVAAGGLVYLVLPGLASPPPVSSALMAAAGVAWGFYTIRGRGSSNPLAETAGNFARAVPMVILIAIPYLYQIHMTNRGLALAALSGAVASGIGYTVWYSALRHLTSTRAAVLQLLVPVITATGGILFLAETATTRLYVAGAMILGGIGMTILGRGKG